MFMCAIQLATACVVFAFILLFLGRWYLGRRREAGRLNQRPTIAFFHPYCNAGGGGEKVLWCGISALQERHPEADILVYTGDTDATGDQILAKARQRFNVRIERPIRFVFLKWRRLVEASTYPAFTLLGQSIGGFVLGVEALFKFCPDVFVESTGFAFTLPLFRYLGNCRVTCYVHYPTISTDMLRLVSERRPTYNNRDAVARNRALTVAKLIYYKIFAKIYGWAGSASHAVMVNSTWTYNHIKTLWNRPDAVITYPPCDIGDFVTISSDECESNLDREIRILSVGQFRPEKDHRKQVRVVKLLKDSISDDQWKKIKWIFVGGCRHEDDYKLVDELKSLAVELGVEDKVEFRINASFDALKSELARALIGVHTMWNEHFGIGVVEHMAAGNIILAHNSGGPKADIVVAHRGETVGFLADTPDEYADMIKRIIELSPIERELIRKAARAAVKERFNENLFSEGFCGIIGSLL